MKLFRVFLFTTAALATAQTRTPVIAVGAILHESNSFHSVKTRLEDFRLLGKELADPIPVWADNNDEVAGFIVGARRHGLSIYPTLVARATPSGPVTNAALDTLTKDLIAKLKAAPKLDGIYLALHGAMVTESFPHGDAEIVRRVREAVGNSIPLIVTHDFHANISPDIVERTTVLINYKTCPHVDQKDRGEKAAEVMSRITKDGVKATQVLVKPGMLYNIRFQNTNVDPLKPIVEATRDLEKDKRFLAASFSGGYQYADVPAMGASVVIATAGDAALARTTAQQLSDRVWSTRGQLKLNVPNAATAVRQAMASSKAPVVLVEMGDNIGGGSAGDSTILLGELLKQRAKGWVVAIADPGAVKQAVSAGIGGVFDAPVGGKTDKIHGDPVQVKGRVKLVYDGKFMETEIRHGGQRYYDQGLSAVIEVDGSSRDLSSYVLLTTERMVPFSLHQLISAGILPERQKILTVKAAIAFRAAYEPIAGEIIEVDTPGSTAINPQRFTWSRVPQTLFGMKP